MADNNKLNKERKKLPKGTLIYTLEIAVNPKEGTVEILARRHRERKNQEACKKIGGTE